MALTNWFQTYIYYLIHPFKTHDGFNQKADPGFELQKMGLYESLGTSWVFVVINGLFRITLINFVLYTFINIMGDNLNYFSIVTNEDRYLGYYFIILSTILDVIFYPLITMFILQFWEFILRTFALILNIEGDVDDKIKSILSVSLSSHILFIIPIFGGMAQKLASFILMYAGLRKQFKTTPSMSICIMAVPLFIFLAFLTFIVFLFVLKSFA